MKRFKKKVKDEIKFFLIKNNFEKEIDFNNGIKIPINSKEKYNIYNNIYAYKVNEGTNEVRFNLIADIDMKIIFSYNKDKIFYPTINKSPAIIYDIIDKLNMNVEIGYFLILQEHKIIILFSQIIKNKVDIFELNDKHQKISSNVNYDIITIIFYDINEIKLSKFKNINVKNDIYEIKPLLNNTWYYLNQFFIIGNCTPNFKCINLPADLNNGKYKFRHLELSFTVNFNNIIEEYNVVDNMSLSIKLAEETQMKSVAFYYTKYNNTLYVLFYKKYKFPDHSIITADEHKCCYSCKKIMKDIKVNVVACLLIGWDWFRRI